ncbi:MAG: peptidylprolyl isomerase [Pseudomonadota bacterium]
MMLTRQFADIALLGSLALAIPTVASAQTQTTPLRPVAVVNDSAITGFDLQQRIGLLRILGFPAASEAALRDEALRRLVDDRLKLQAGTRLGLQPNRDALDNGFADIAQQLGARPEELLALMRNQGITTQAVDDFVAAGLVWNEVVRTRFASRIEPGEAEIDGEIALAGGAARSDYRIQEIGLAMTGDGRSEAETRALADRLRAELSEGGDFAAAARRFSSAPSAEQGGEVGWVSSGTLPAELNERLQRLAPGEISAPLPVPGGISLIRLIERRDQGGGGDSDDPQLRERVRRQIIREQSERLAEGLLQELRRDALIELR